MATVSIRPTLPLDDNLRLVARMTHALVVLLLASSIAGLLYGPRGWWYDPDPSTLPAFLGQDVITLLLAVPLLIASSMLAQRGSLRGLICWMGVLFYVAYSYYFYVVGGRFTLYFPLYIAIVSMGAYGALALLFSVDLPRLPARFAELPVRLLATCLMMTALCFAGLWLAVLEGHYVRGAALPAVPRAVIAIDGVILLPLLFFAGRALARREPVGYALAGMLLFKASTTFLTLLVNTAIAARWGQEVDGLQTVAYLVGFTGGATLLIWYLRSITAAPREASQAAAFTSPARTWRVSA
jgi:hypothetical protein